MGYEVADRVRRDMGGATGTVVKVYGWGGVAVAWDAGTDVDLWVDVRTIGRFVIGERTGSIMERESPLEATRSVNQALRNLANATRDLTDPDEVYEILSELQQGLPGLEQSLAQIANFIRRHSYLAADDSGDPAYGEQNAHAAATALYSASHLTDLVGAWVERSHTLNARIAWRPMSDVPSPAGRDLDVTRAGLTEEWDASRVLVDVANAVIAMNDAEGSADLAAAVARGQRMMAGTLFELAETLKRTAARFTDAVEDGERADVYLWRAIRSLTDAGLVAAKSAQDATCAQRDLSVLRRAQNRHRPRRSAGLPPVAESPDPGASAPEPPTM